MPFTPVRTQGEPLEAGDAADLVRFFETGRAPNPGLATAQKIDAVLQTDLPVSGHGDDIYLGDYDDLIYDDRTPNPASAQSHVNQPPDAKWRVKGTPLRDLVIDMTRQRGDAFRVGKKKALPRMPALLKNGNSKVQCYTWDLPEGPTCPARSAFCVDCYAVSMAAGTKRASMMASRMIRLKAWVEHNEAWRAEMVAECRHYGAFAPVRIHVAGDFFSEHYTRDWIHVVSACPDTHFWAYTRSWNADRRAKGGTALVRALEELRDLSNMTLFASFDPTMPCPPATWLHAGIYGDPRVGVNENGSGRVMMICPEIAGTPADWKGVREEGRPPLMADGFPRFHTCRACGWCWNKSDVAPTPDKVATDTLERGSEPMKGARGDVAFPHHGHNLELPVPGTVKRPPVQPTPHEVQVYTVYRNGLQEEKVGGRKTGRLVYGRGNRVVESDAMLQLGTAQKKVELARQLALAESGKQFQPKDVYGPRDKKTGKRPLVAKKGAVTANSWMAKFYREEFDRLLDGVRVANRQIERYWQV